MKIYMQDLSENEKEAIRIHAHKRRLDEIADDIESVYYSMAGESSGLDFDEAELFLSKAYELMRLSETIRNFAQ